METGFAIRTAKIDDGCVTRERVERIGCAAWAIEFACGPRFVGNAGALRSTFVIL